MPFNLMGQPQELPLWRNRRKSHNSPIFVRPTSGWLWKYPRNRRRHLRRRNIAILVMVFGLVIFAIASHVLLILRSAEQTLVSMPDIRLRASLGLER
jgi:hypothetical protein